MARQAGRVTMRLGRVALALGAVLLAAFWWFRTPDTDPAAMRARYGGPPSHYVDVGHGLTVHLRDTGPRGAPVLMLVHGSNDSLFAWEPWAARLERRFRVVRFDLPGHGLTGASPDGRYDSAAFVAIVERVRAKLGIDRIALAGNSMGGGVAWRYALAHPDRVDALVLVDAAGQPDPGDRPAPLAFRIARTPGVRQLATFITPRGLVESTLRQAFHDPRMVTSAMVDRSWELLRYPGNRRATIARFALPPDPGSPDQLHAIRTPTLILWGADDRIIPVRSAHWFAANIPGSRLIIYPDTGHAPMEERADRSAADVAAFLGRH